MRLSKPFCTNYRYVEGSDLLVCGQYGFYHYRDCKDANYFLCGDVINDVIALNSQKVIRELHNKKKNIGKVRDVVYPLCINKKNFTPFTSR